LGQGPRVGPRGFRVSFGAHENGEGCPSPRMCRPGAAGQSGTRTSGMAARRLRA